MIWDLHTHYGWTPGETPEQRIETFLEHAERLDVERVVTFMGSRDRPDRPSADQLRKDNDLVLRAIEAFPERVLGFCYVSGEQIEASLDEIERCVADGPMVGLKLWVARPCSDPAMMPLFERAAELGVVIFQHTWIKTTGNREGESTPTDLAVLAERLPETTVICGHSGGNWDKAIRAVRAGPNVPIGTGGFDPEAGYTEMAVRELGEKRVMFGSDAYGRSFASQLAKIRGARVSDQAKQLMLGENLRRVLTPILEKKGLPQ